MAVTADVHRSSDTVDRSAGTGRDRSPIVAACTRILATEPATDRPPEPTVSPDLTLLHDLAADWVQRGGTAETFHRAVRSAVDVAFSRIAATGSATALVPSLRRLVTAHEVITRSISAGLTRPLVAGTGSPIPALRNIAGAVADDRPEALPPGARISTSYAVLALTLQPTEPGDRSPREALSTATEHAYDAPHRIRLMLAAEHGPSALSALGPHGGTILLPAESRATAAELMADLVAAAGFPVTAILLEAPRTAIVTAADIAHELLDLVRRLRYAPGIYRFRDLALEYQLTRPGAARAELAALVAPLYDHPELLDTLRLYIRTRLRRQATAHILELHRNTVDYRLRRIQELTGCDPVQQTGLWYLQSGLIAHSYESGATGQCPGNRVESRCPAGCDSAAGSESEQSR
ncbi:PucR family transcriptional regulator [Nocardia sp. NPDC003963]